jgi:hypothetical protein
MKAVVICAALLALMPAVAVAQYNAIPYHSPYSQAPRTTTTVDPQSGSVYTTTRRANGQTDIQGSNLQTGAMWRSRIEPNGNQSGTDANGNLWTYDRKSGAYMNTDGRSCIGTGPLRSCN